VFRGRSIEKLFAEADADGSGEVSMLEWSRAIKKFPELTKQGKPSAFAEYISPVEFFAHMDKDGSGVVSQAELTAALTKANVSPKAVEMIFAKITASSDFGEIDCVEWLKAVRASPELLPEKLGKPTDASRSDRIVSELAEGLKERGCVKDDGCIIH